MTLPRFTRRRLLLAGFAVSLLTVGIASTAAFRLSSELRAFAWRVEIVAPREATVVPDSDGQPAFSLADGQRTSVRLHEIAPAAVRAVLAAEDRRFYAHHGADPVAIVRAAWRNLRAGRVVQGASSITQQLARAVLDERARTFSRKLREIVVALELERRFTKDELLEAYLNTVYFGNGNYGIHAAAQGYFGKDPRDLDVVEAATLAALIPAPSSLSQSREAEALRARRDRVLARMHEDGLLSREALDAARRTHMDAPLATLALDPERQQARIAFLDQCAGSRHNDSALQHDVSRAHAGMTCEWQFLPRREYAQPVVRRRLGRGQDERRLGEIEPGCDRLHVGRFETCCVEHDRERVAAAPRTREDIDLVEVALLHNCSQCVKVAAWPMWWPNSSVTFHTVARWMRKRRPDFATRTPE
jgi:membrane peptidoglycan carboxypeptidase